jgi:hypothetical protein
METVTSLVCSLFMQASRYFQFLEMENVVSKF